MAIQVCSIAPQVSILRSKATFTSINVVEISSFTLMWIWEILPPPPKKKKKKLKKYEILLHNLYELQDCLVTNGTEQI